MCPATETKNRWRRTLRAQRSIGSASGNLPSTYDFEQSISRLVAELKPRRIASFVPHRSEPPILGLPSGCSLLLPRLFSRKGDALPAGTWAWWEPGQPLEGPKTWAPPQPLESHPGTLKEVDLVLVPGLAVDRLGTRLGQGGGWYDRALLSLPTDAQAAMVVYDWEVLPAGALPREPHDIRIPWAVTNLGVMSFPQVGQAGVIHS